MARPKKDPSSRRTEAVNVALSPVELAAIQDKADRGKTNVTAFVRAAALGKSVTVTESTAPEFATRHELRRIGSNINQIAKAMNAGKAVPSSQVDRVFSKLETLLDRWLDHDAQSRTRPQL